MRPIPRPSEAPDSDPSAEAATGAATADAQPPEVAALLRALLQLAAAGGGEVARVAEAVHQAILLGPLGFVPEARALADRLPLPFRLPYRVVAQGLDAAANLLHTSERVPPSQELPWLRLMAVLNGVYGDALAEQGSPLAMAMTLRDANGQPCAWPDGSAPIWLYLNGLCGIDTDWHTAEHATWVAERAALGERTVYLRMNSGLSIWRNGGALDALLQAQMQTETQAPAPLVVVCHSLGGLVFRSAMAHAQTRDPQADWLQRVARVVFLGTPHAGAPLERAGHVLTQLLPMTHYTEPFARLANIRSQAVRDLRYGAVTQAQSARIDAGLQLEEEVPLPSGPAYVFVAASLGQSPLGTPLGDGMVPVDSAYGSEALAQRLAVAPPRHLLAPMSHVGLVQDPRVYALLRQVVAESTAKTVPIA